MNEREFAKALERACAWVVRYFEHTRDHPVLSQVRPGDVARALPSAMPEEGEDFDALLDDFERIVLPGITHWNHPRFFAYFSITGSEPAVLAELLCAALNVNAMAWSTSPAATELELLALDWLADLLGLPAGWHGHIEDSA